MKAIWIGLSAMLLTAGAANAQQDVKVMIDGGRIEVQMPGSMPGMAAAQDALRQGNRAVVETQSGGTSTAIGPGNSASVSTGIAPGAQIEGVSVINGEVWIDGEKVPPGVRRVTGKSGRHYAIERSGGTVQVREE